MCSCECVRESCMRACPSVFLFFSLLFVVNAAQFFVFSSVFFFLLTRTRDIWGYMELKKKKNSGTRTHACKTHVHYRQTGKKKKKKKTCIGSSFSHLPILHAHTRKHTNVQTISYCTYSFFFFMLCGFLVGFSQRLQHCAFFFSKTQ